MEDICQIVRPDMSVCETRVSFVIGASVTSAGDEGPSGVGRGDGVAMLAV